MNECQNLVLHIIYWYIYLLLPSTNYYIFLGEKITIFDHILMIEFSPPLSTFINTNTRHVRSGTLFMQWASSRRESLPTKRHMRNTIKPWILRELCSSNYLFLCWLHLPSIWNSRTTHKKPLVLRRCQMPGVAMSEDDMHAFQIKA